MNTDITRPTGTDLHIAIADVMAAHRAVGWHTEWSRLTVITNLIDVMSDVDTTDPASLAILADPEAAKDLARNLDAIS